MLVLLLYFKELINIQSFAHESPHLLGEVVYIGIKITPLGKGGTA
jgi:hypothetical protein